MYYGTISHETFMDLVNKLELEEPRFWPDIPISEKFVNLVKYLIEKVNDTDHIIAYYQPRESIIVVETDEFTIKYNIPFDYPQGWDDSWENFKFYIPVKYITNVEQDNILSFCGWLIESKYVGTLFHNQIDCPPKNVIVTTFEASGVGITHTVQYA